MDKSTVALAEQVGVFLAPMMRAMIVAAFKESGLATKIEVLTSEHAKLVAKVVEFATPVETALSGHADALRKLDAQVDGVERDMSRVHAEQVRFDSQLMQTASKDQVDELRTYTNAAVVVAAKSANTLDQDLKTMQADVERLQRELLAAASEHARLNDLVLQLASKDQVEALGATIEADRTRTAEVLTEIGEGHTSSIGAICEVSEGLASLREELLRGIEQVSASVTTVKEEANVFRTEVEARASAAEEKAITLRDSVVNLVVSMDTSRADILEALEQSKSASVSYADELFAKVPAAPEAPTVFQVVEACKGLLSDVVDGAVHKALPDAVQQSVQAAVAALPRAKDGDPGPVGLMPLAEPYVEGRIYERAAVVFYAGGTWQATRPTKAPPAANKADWQALVTGVAGLSVQAGADLRAIELKTVLSDGTEATTQASLPVMVYRGVYSATETYVPGDVVTQDGSMWHTDKTCVGYTPTQSPEYWKLAVKSGKAGTKGKDGLDGVQFKAGYAGEYEEDKVYPQNSIVTYASSIWLAKRPTKERPPYLTNADSDHWLRVR